MKILFVSNVYPTPSEPTRGVFNAALVDALRIAGNDVRCLVPVSWVNRIMGPPAARLTKPRPHTTYQTWFYPPRILRAHYHHFMWWSMRRPLRQIIRDWRPDLVLSFWVHPDADVARRFARTIGVPIVAVAGGSDLLVLPRDPARKRAIARVLRTVDGVLTDGQHLARTAVSLGADPTRVHAFYRGVDRSTFAPGDRDDARRRLGLAPGTPILLSVGNLVHVKGTDILLDALARAGAEAPWHLVIIGDGARRPALEQQVRTLGLMDRVRFVGRVEHGQLPHWYRAANLVVLTSRSEGIPNVLLEALACRTPFLATDVGGISEIAPDPSWLVKPEDAEAMAAGLRRAYLHPWTAPATPPADWSTVATEFAAQLRAWCGPVS